MRRAGDVFSVKFNHRRVRTQADGCNSVSLDEGQSFQLQIVHRAKEDNWCPESACIRAYHMRCAQNAVSAFVHLHLYLRAPPKYPGGHGLHVRLMHFHQPRPTVPSCSKYIPLRPLAETDDATVSETAAVPKARKEPRWLQMSKSEPSCGAMRLSNTSR